MQRASRRATIGSLADTTDDPEVTMQIGKPKRIYTIEPIEDPVPKLPAEDPDRTSEPRPLEPVEGAPRRP